MKKRLLFLSVILLCAGVVPLFSQCGFAVSTTVTHVTCYNGTSGSVTVSASGGTAPYQYQLAVAGAGAWASNNIFNGLAAGNYPVSVRDATGCISTVYITITQPDQLVVSYTATDPTCSGSSNGAISIAVSGGIAPYSYSWTKDAASYSTAASLSGLSAGNYLLVVTDASGCTTSPIVTQQIKTVSLTGFNEDVVANGTNVSASSRTSQALDDANGYVLYASGYTNSNGSGTKGLPSSGSFNSAQDASRPYQLASYSSSNALLLRSSTATSYGGNTSGTLTFASQNRSPYSTLYVVGTTGSGTGTVDYTVNFADNSTYSGTLNFQDWYLSSSTASAFRALGDLGRVSRSSNPGTIDNTGNFNLWEAPISIPGASQSKVINSVTFSWSGSGAARANIFAITGYTSTISGIRINDGAASSVTPAVSIVSDASSNQFCSGQSVTFTATPVNGGNTPSYQWKRNGNNVGSNSPSYTTGSLSNNDQVRVVMTASGSVGCLTTTTANSSTITMTTAAKPVSVSMTASGTNVCSGQSVTFTAAPVNGGSSPSYQWRLNGTNVGSNSPVYINNALNDNDQVRVIVTSNIGCATNNPATSSPVNIHVIPNGTPSVTITSVPAITLLIASMAFEGNSPGYQWFRNGAPIGGATGPVYINLFPVPGDVYSLQLNSSYACRTAPAAMSNYIVANHITLPVVMEWFTLQTEDNKRVLLNWKTSSEFNNKRFIVQRALASSADYTDIGTVPATNLSQGSSYSYIDEPGLPGIYRYRLVQEDLDGRQEFSAIRTANLAGNKYSFVSDRGSAWQINSNVLLHYSLLDMQGRLIEKGSFTGVRIIEKPVSNAIYLLQTEYNGEIITHKLVK